MYAKDITALDELALLPRVIHDSDEVNPSWTGLDLELPGPLWAEVPANWVGRITNRREDALGSIWLAPPVKMKLLVPMMREARELGAIAAGVDFSALATDLETRPRNASELSELQSACGLPFVIGGLLDPRDAERAAEAGADVIIASSSLSSWLGGPSLVALIPDIRDAVGDTLLFAKGAVRNGADVLRYLALGVDAVVLPNALNPHQMLEELSRAMRVTGCNTLDEISYDLIFEPTFD